MFTVRSVIPTDKGKIISLYEKVAMISGGIARSKEEISEEYIEDFMRQAETSGIQLVIDHPEKPGLIIAEIHAYKAIPKVFAHVMGNLTIAVDPDFQGRGVGKILFTHFLEFITNNRPDIMRVELLTQESNEKAINLYKKVGFIIEGRLEKRIKMYDDRIEADIPMAWFNRNYEVRSLKSED
jgi:ribosomal protein S18 acetylase RimI-like enzyme